MSHKWLNMGKEIAPELPIADDVPANLRILRNALEPETYETLEACSREAILEIAGDFLPDTILLSSMTSAMDVYEVYWHHPLCISQSSSLQCNLLRR